VIEIAMGITVPRIATVVPRVNVNEVVFVFLVLSILVIHVIIIMNVSRAAVLLIHVILELSVHLYAPPTLIVQMGTAAVKTNV
jgi:hypothetical protein